MDDRSVGGNARDGRLPFRLRVGVTGHRTLPDETLLAKSVAAAVDRIAALVPGPRLSTPDATPVAYTVISPIAEGADRLVARVLIDDFDADLEVPVPLAIDDYKRDFDTDASKREFDDLLDRAVMRSTAPAFRTRNQAYEAVGRHVVDRCDVLLALWDGEAGRGRGGTAEMVAYARRHLVPLVVIDTTTGALREELGPSESWLADVRQEWRRVDGYNSARIRADFGQAVNAADSQLMDLGLTAGLTPSGARRIADWLAPFVARAGLLASQCRDLYVRLTTAVFLLAALAVVTVTVQVLFFPEKPELAAIELVMLLVLLAIVALGRWRKINRRFICDRFFAERLREAPFLVVAGHDRPRGRGFKRSYLGHQPEGWPWRAFAEVWNRRPTGSDVVVADAHALRDLVAETWIVGQIRYHERAGAKNRRLQRLVFWGSVGLLSMTVVAATLHVAEVGGHDTDGLTWPNLWVLVSIGAPALGGALSGIGAQREYARHAERSDRMIEYLREARADVVAAEDLDGVREATRETAELMLAENRDWFGALSFRDLEPHS